MKSNFITYLHQVGWILYIESELFLGVDAFLMFQEICLSENLVVWSQEIKLVTKSLQYPLLYRPCQRHQIPSLKVAIKCLAPGAQEQGGTGAHAPQYFEQLVHFPLNNFIRPCVQLNVCPSNILHLPTPLFRM